MINLGSILSTNRPVNLDTKRLTNHAFVVAGSGQGKTGCVINMAEELVRENVPVLLIDIKSDLANILKQDGPLKDQMAGRLLTPGADHGEPVNLFAKLVCDEGRDQAVTALLDLLGVESNKSQHSFHLFFTTILKDNFQDISFSLEELLPLILEPGIDNLGMLPLDEVLPFSVRKTLAIKLNNLIANEEFTLWRTGTALDFDSLFESQNDKTPVVVYSVAHLVDDKQRTMALSFVLSEYLSWTLKQSGSQSLRSVLVIDECVGLAPPYPKNPPTKAVITTLLKQARAFGNGVILSTQSAKDVDYKIVAQCRTHIVGRLQAKHDRERVLEGLEGVPNFDKNTFSRQISSLLPRQFMVITDGVEVIRSADVETELTGPMSVKDLQELTYQDYVVSVDDDEGFKAMQLVNLWSLYKSTNDHKYLEQYVQMESK